MAIAVAARLTCVDTMKIQTCDLIWMDPWQMAWKLRAITTLAVVTAAMTPSLVAEDLDTSGIGSDFVGHFRDKLTQPANVRMPGDFEVHHDLVFAIGDSCDSFHETIATVARAVRDRIRVVVLVNSEYDLERTRAAMKKAGCDPSKVALIHMTCDTRWIRDFGPTCVDDGKNSRWIDWIYDPDRPNDDEIPDTLIGMAGYAPKFVPLVIEGGNLLSNGQGVVLTSTEVFTENPQTYTQEDAILEIATTLNASDVVVLQPLAGEDTGHVDMFAAFVTPETVFVGHYNEDDDPVNSAVLDRNAEILAGVTTASGKKLRVVRIPMDRNNDLRWRTYTNCIFANGVVLVPTYKNGSKQLAQAAIERYEQHLPGWKVIGVDASELIECGGALRCASLCLFRNGKQFKSTDPAAMPLLPISIPATAGKFVKRQ